MIVLIRLLFFYVESEFLNVINCIFLYDKMNEVGRMFALKINRLTFWNLD